MPAAPHLDRSLRDALRDGVARASAVIGLAGVALIHVLDVPGKLDETPWMGVLFLALIAACLATGAALLVSSDSRAWAAAAVLPLAAVVGYALTRTTGLPQATDDIGNWTEPLGLASLFVEGCLAALATTVLAARLAGERVAGGAYAAVRAQ